MPELTPMDMPVDPMTMGANTMMPQEPMPLPAAPPSGEGGELDTVPKQVGVMGGNSAGEDIGLLMFEDIFPKLELSDDEREAVVAWMEKDLRSCVKSVNNMKNIWAKYRAVYMLEYVEKFYPDMGIGADYASGLLCERMLEAMNRMKRSIYSALPLFAVDSKRTGVDVNPDTLMRMQWFMHTIMIDELDIYNAVGDGGMFDFLLDGSLIMEADTIYEKIPQRTIKVYTEMEQLAADEDKVIDSAHFQRATMDLQQFGIARVLVEENIITKNGLQLFRVDKIDHLVPEGVYSDKNMRFRARRMYMTGSDLRLMASEDVAWYDKKAVEEIIGGRDQARTNRRFKYDEKNKMAADELRKYTENYDLAYQWMDEDDQLKVTEGSQPYSDVFAVYRVTCKYGYRTSSDPEGVIPKYVQFDYSPEGKKILRSVTYPHFTDNPNWFHLKFGYAPKSYYGFGFGARIMQDDFLESNAVDLFMDSSALATFNPFLSKHPDAGGRIPFSAGYGPGKIGYVNDVNDFKQMQVTPPSEGLLRMILPLTQTRVSNRTNITTLVQGRTETSDPRAPAQKAAMLLGQANVGLDVMVEDWNKTGWNNMVAFVWKSIYETATFIKSIGGDLSGVFGGLVMDGDVSVVSEYENRITMDELNKEVVWSSLASTDYLNPTTRMNKFMQLYNIFMPMLDKLAQINPGVYKIYFLRWMNRAAQELDVPGGKFLIPSKQELDSMPIPAMQEAMKGMMGNMRANMSQQGMMTMAGQQGGGQ